MNITAENVRTAKQECLMSSSDETSVVLEKFLLEKLHSLSEERLEKIVKVDPSGMLAHLEKSLVCHQNDVKEAMERGECLRLGNMDRISRSDLAE